MLEHFLCEWVTFLQNGSPVRREPGTRSPVHTRAIGSGPEGIRKLRSLKETVEGSQVAVVLTLKSENAVSPFLPL